MRRIKNPSAPREGIGESDALTYLKITQSLIYFLPFDAIDVDRNGIIKRDEIFICLRTFYRLSRNNFLNRGITELVEVL